MILCPKSRCHEMVIVRRLAKFEIWIFRRYCFKKAVVLAHQYQQMHLCFLVKIRRDEQTVGHLTTNETFGFLAACLQDFKSWKIEGHSLSSDSHSRCSRFSNRA